MGAVVFLAIKIAKFSQRAVILVADDHMVNQLDLQQLAGANEVTRHLDVGLRRGAFTARMIMDDHD